ncbi:MAG: HYR domain-containing protein [Bacteroidota bacterium]
MKRKFYAHRSLVRSCTRLLFAALLWSFTTSISKADHPTNFDLDFFNLTTVNADFDLNGCDNDTIAPILFGVPLDDTLDCSDTIPPDPVTPSDNCPGFQYFVTNSVSSFECSPGLAAWWPAEGNANDAQGSLNASLINGTTFSSGIAGDGFALDGQNDYIVVNDTVRFASGDYSVTYWFNTSDTTQNQTIFSATDTLNGNPGVLLSVDSNGVASFLHRFPFGTTGGTTITSTPGLNDGNWHQIVAVKSDTTMFLFIDNVLQGTAVDTTDIDEPVRITMGRLSFQNFADNEYFNGTLDENRVYSKALCAQEIQGLYLAGAQNGNWAPTFRLTRTWTVIDGAGNFATADQDIIFVDRTAPTLTVPAPLTIYCNDSGGVSIQNGQVQNWLGSASGTDECTCVVLTFTAPSVFPAGCQSGFTSTVTFSVTDECGNLTVGSSTITVIDSTAPDLTCANITVNADANCEATVVNYNVSGDDECSGAPATLNYSIAPGSTFNIGTTTVTATGADACGNSTSCNFDVTVLDNTAPTALCQNITVQAGAAGATNITAGDIDNGSTDNCGVASLSVSPSSFTCQDAGANTATLTVTDGAGNTSTCTSTVTVQAGNGLNAVCQDITVQLDAAGNATITAADIDNGSSNSCGSISLSLDQTTFTCADIGTNTVTLSATDGNGNTETCTATVTVEDVTPPTAVCQDITVQIESSGTASIVPNDINGGCTDNCGITSLTASMTTFTCADQGANTVTLTATDAAGNTSSCFAVVTVQAAGAPVAVCQDITVQLDANGSATITAADIDNGSSNNNNCGGLLLSLDQTTFTCADLGANTVTLTADDGNGNTATCTATVTVESQSSLSITCPSDITIPCSAAGNGAVATWDLPTVTSIDPCGGNTCPADPAIPGFIFLGEFNGHRYYCSNGDNFTWNQANTAAQNAGGELLSINSAAENQWVANQIMAGFVWIGLNDVANEGSFEWSNGDAVTYTNWKNGEPNNAGGACCPGTYGADYAVLKRNNKRWYDRGGCSQYEFVMEIPCADYTLAQTAGPASGCVFPEGTTTVEYLAYNSNGDSVTCSFDVTVEECMPVYCDVNGNTNYEWINSVDFGSISNQSGNDYGYGDYTAHSTALTTGQSATITLTPGFSGQSYHEKWKVFIDWNRDGDFWDAGETAFWGQGSGAVSGTITVPAHAVTGSVRMRVVMRWNSWPGACGSGGNCSSYGEAEDYTLSISAGAKTAHAAPVVMEDAPEADNPAPVELYELFPNPVLRQAGAAVTVGFRTENAAAAKVMVTDLRGQVLHVQGVEAVAGHNEVVIPVTELAAGMYIMQIQTGDAPVSRKFVVR